MLSGSFFTLTKDSTGKAESVGHCHKKLKTTEGQKVTGCYKKNQVWVNDLTTFYDKNIIDQNDGLSNIISGDSFPPYIAAKLYS